MVENRDETIISLGEQIITKLNHMIERLEKYEKRKILNTKTNSESDMAREDFDLEAPEEIKDVDSEDQEEIEGVLEKQEVDVVSGMKDETEDIIVPRMQDELDDDIVGIHRLEAKSDDEYTWKQFFQENFSVERNQLSEPLCFNLEDKVHLVGVGIDGSCDIMGLLQKKVRSE